MGTMHAPGLPGAAGAAQGLPPSGRCRGLAQALQYHKIRPISWLNGRTGWT